MNPESQDSDSLAGSPGEAVVDSHVHFWDPRHLDYPWLKEVPPLARPFTPEDFAVAAAGPVSAIFVEAGRAEPHAAAEIDWVRDAAHQHPWILGAVAHVPLEQPEHAEIAIRRCRDDPFVVGVRRNVQDEAPGFTANDDFRAGIRRLGEAGLPFDACVREHQLPELVDLAAACPETVIVLDHLGKPQSAEPGWSPWRQALRQLAGFENVVCKLSGLATEIDPSTPRPLVISLLREAVEVFGAERCLYGGDWPVMTLATSYEDWLGLVLEALAPCPPQSADAVLRTNARRVYRIRAAATSPGHSARMDLG